MKWFKHETKRKSSLKRLIMEYGIEGYGLYYLCMELISGDITIDNLTFELEDDAELIAHEFKMDTIRVEKIMHRCIELGLFDLSDNGRVRCLTLAKMLDESISKNTHVKEIKKKITEKLDNSGNIPEQLRRPSDQNRLDKSRLDENRQDKNIYIYDLLDEWNNQLNTQTHKKTTIERNIKKRRLNTYLSGCIEDYGVDEIKRAISNYSHILGSEIHYWTHSWGFIEFMERGLDKFIDSANPLDVYRDKKVKTKEPEMSLEDRIKKNEEELGNIFEGGN